MYKSIQHFNELGVKKIEKVVESFITDESMDIGDFVISLDKPLRELQRAIIKETLEEIDKVYRKAKYRKDRYVIERRGDSNSFLATCGEITYNRTYFKSKTTGGYEYLTDQACGITPNMRKSDDVVVKAIENVVTNSYKLSGKNATNTDDIVSKQAIMKEVHELEVPTIIPKIKSKRKVPILFINADEDHVSLQYQKKKGDLVKDNKGRKSNTIEPRLIYIFEGIEKEGPKSQRNKLVGKHYFGGIYANSEELWEEVLIYINAIYDEESIRQIYIMGDGAPWIKKGLDVLGSKSCFVLDKFHLNQSIVKATAHLGDSVADGRGRIYDAISFEDKEELRKVFELILNTPASEAKIKQIYRSRTYIENHWEAIIIKNDNADARIGCSAEGHVSHIYSDRLSSRPLGWSKIGVDKMARLRVYAANGGKIYDLIKYKEEKKEREMVEEIKEMMDQSIRKRRKTYTDVWSHQTTAGSVGVVNGMYHLTKALRGICG